jgi:uncharacterized protein YbcC (UPF0753/DUF2309 family)
MDGSSSSFEREAAHSKNGHGQRSGSPAEILAAAIAHARHLLPSQAPLQGFVHHNTLHAFEHLPFHQGVLAASKCFGAEPFEREEVFARHLASGRIRPRDIDAVLVGDQVDDEPLFPGGPGRRTLRKLRLEHVLELPAQTPLRWWIEESDALRRIHPSVGSSARATLLEGAKSEAECVRELWNLLARAAEPSRLEHVETVPASPRPRDRLLARTGIDTDELVHPLLTRLAAAYIDQGMAYWTMPRRHEGLYAAFCELYRRRFGPPDPWLHGLADRLTRQLSEGWTIERVVIETLGELGVDPGDWEEVVTRTLSSLGGWAGMIQQMETHSEWAPVQVLPATLLEYLAVQLMLDAQAYAHVSGEADDEVPVEAWPHVDDRWRALAYEAFVIAQLAGLPARSFDEPAHVQAYLAEIAAFDSLARRWTLQRAYERNYYVGILDSMLEHAAMGVVAPQAPVAQLVFCFDDREESLRRHLEEHMPSVETLGYAGFFSLPIRFLGLDAIRPRQLCPVVLTPRHLIVEEPVDPSQAEAYANRRRRFGQLQHASFIGGRTFLRGGLISLGLGLAAMIPLVARTLAPRTAAKIGYRARKATLGRPATRLRLERAEDEGPDADGLLHGFTLTEMAKIVGDALETLGIAQRLAPLVILIAHGSDSLNNPHGAAYACGACSGGNGGPNSRAFAQIANRADVRALLSERGIDIPPSVHFVGAYHDTCSDEVEYHDLEGVPEPLRASLATVQRALEVAIKSAAHERSRRFMSAPLDMNPAQALAHVEARAVDLAQPRPELGHVTNAIAFVGRRHSTRGLFLDRRVFLISWDPITDPTGLRLGPLLQAAGPVGAGINLEYLFSYLDNAVYGCGSKLPHNVAGLIGVMDGHSSDLRTGLPRQMIEIHEPVRLLFIVEAEPELITKIVGERPMVLQLVANEWIIAVAWSPSTGKMFMFRNGAFEPYEPESTQLPVVRRSIEHYRGKRDHLPCARVEAGIGEEASP